MQKKLPGGRLTVHYTRKNAKKPHCAECKRVLSGVPRGSQAYIRKWSKTERRPERPYGGVLCTKCMRAHMKEKARSSEV